MPKTLPMQIDAKTFLTLTVKALPALNARDQDFLIEAMRRYANLVVEEHLEAEHQKTVAR
jgi:hypothetical protein